MKITAKFGLMAQQIKNLSLKKAGKIQQKQANAPVLKSPLLADTFTKKDKRQSKKLTKNILKKLKEIGIEPLSKKQIEQQQRNIKDYIYINDKCFEAVDLMLALGYKSNETDKIISNIEQLSKQSNCIKTYGQVVRYAPLNTKLYEVFEQISKQ